jgi:hypothetical protein
VGLNRYFAVQISSASTFAKLIARPPTPLEEQG